MTRVVGTWTQVTVFMTWVEKCPFCQKSWCLSQIPNLSNNDIFRGWSNCPSIQMRQHWRVGNKTQKSTFLTNTTRKRPICKTIDFYFSFPTHQILMLWVPKVIKYRCFGLVGWGGHQLTSWGNPKCGYLMSWEWDSKITWTWPPVLNSVGDSCNCTAVEGGQRSIDHWKWKERRHHESNSLNNQRELTILPQFSPKRSGCNISSIMPC